MSCNGMSCHECDVVKSPVMSRLVISCHALLYLMVSCIVIFCSDLSCMLSCDVMS